MKADPSAQRALLDLATIDTQQARLAHRLRSLPEIAQLGELNTQRLAAAEAVVAVETRLSDLDLDARRIEGDITPARERLERNEQRSNDGSVSNPKALRGLLDEIEHLKGRIARLEDDQLDVMEQIETETAERDRLVDGRTRVENRMRELMASRDAAAAEITAEATSLDTDRADLLTRVPTDVAALYAKLAERQGTGAAELVGRRCSGCGLEVDIADLRRLSSAPDDEVLRCEECGRILVRTTQSDLLT